MKLTRLSAMSPAAVRNETTALSSSDDNSLVVAWGSNSPIENVDNYFNTNQTGTWSSRMVWDQPSRRNTATFEYEPPLAPQLRSMQCMEYAGRQAVTPHIKCMRVGLAPHRDRPPHALTFESGTGRLSASGWGLAVVALTILLVAAQSLTL